jgi:hypothetical protein
LAELLNPPLIDDSVDVAALWDPPLTEEPSAPAPRPGGIDVDADSW